MDSFLHQLQWKLSMLATFVSSPELLRLYKWPTNENDLALRKLNSPLLLVQGVESGGLLEQTHCQWTETWSIVMGHSPQGKFQSVVYACGDRMDDAWAQGSSTTNEHFGLCTTSGKINNYYAVIIGRLNNGHESWFTDGKVIIWWPCKLSIGICRFRTTVTNCDGWPNGKGGRLRRFYCTTSYIHYNSKDVLYMTKKCTIFIVFYLRLGLPSGLFPSGFPTNTPDSSTIRATWGVIMYILTYLLHGAESFLRS